MCNVYDLIFCFSSNRFEIFRHYLNLAREKDHCRAVLGPYLNVQIDQIACEGCRTARAKGSASPDKKDQGYSYLHFSQVHTIYNLKLHSFFLKMGEIICLPHTPDLQCWRKLKPSLVQVVDQVH